MIKSSDRRSPSKDYLKRKDWEFDDLLSNLIEAGCYVVPVDHIPPSINILGAVIHVVEIV